MDKRKAVKRMLSNLSRQNFNNFCYELVNRQKEPRVARNRVEEKSFLEITDVLTSTFSETGAVEVSAELLIAIDCHTEAAQLLKDAGDEYSEPGSRNMGATGGPASENGSRDSEHFVDKHRTELINRWKRLVYSPRNLVPVVFLF
ncbi:hypothetical protein CgunFtcFv8_019308 [Champsocephalus gunnari]|uniref:Pyrin domain-containing protein n=1 Tax=Champsocephalus gunnari TaxID=52237 RepID=A0AAN8DHL2_CHAGU|nr:hypothetical protein CgunFtcFv8_019308 [Champsocephalus gunnari]